MNLYGLSNDILGIVPTHYEVQGLDTARSIRVSENGIHFGGFHSAVVVVAANSIEEAKALIRTDVEKQYTGEDADKWDRDKWAKKDPDVDWWPWIDLIQPIIFDTATLIAYAEGEC